MNKISAHVKNISSLDILNVVSFDFLGFDLSMMSLELNDVHVGNRVILTVKPSSVAIGKNFSGDLSFTNQIKGVVKRVENGKLLSFLEVEVGDNTIQSVITKKSAKRMDIKLEDEVICIFKASDLSILKVEK